jgi:hypothetical protein
VLKENFELKKQLRFRVKFLNDAEEDINRLKMKVNRLMVKLEEDNFN